MWCRGSMFDDAFDADDAALDDAFLDALAAELDGEGDDGDADDGDAAVAPAVRSRSATTTYAAPVACASASSRLRQWAMRAAFATIAARFGKSK